METCHQTVTFEQLKHLIWRETGDILTNKIYYIGPKGGSSSNTRKDRIWNKEGQLVAHWLVAAMVDRRYHLHHCFHWRYGVKFSMALKHTFDPRIPIKFETGGIDILEDAEKDLNNILTNSNFSYGPHWERIKYLAKQIGEIGNPEITEGSGITALRTSKIETAMEEYLNWSLLVDLKEFHPNARKDSGSDGSQSLTDNESVRGLEIGAIIGGYPIEAPDRVVSPCFLDDMENGEENLKFDMDIFDEADGGNTGVASVTGGAVGGAVAARDAVSVAGDNTSVTSTLKSRRSKSKRAHRVHNNVVKVNLPLSPESPRLVQRGAFGGVVNDDYDNDPRTIAMRDRINDLERELMLLKELYTIQVRAQNKFLSSGGQGNQSPPGPGGPSNSGGGSFGGNYPFHDRNHYHRDSNNGGAPFGGQHPSSDHNYQGHYSKHGIDSGDPVSDFCGSEISDVSYSDDSEDNDDVCSVSQNGDSDEISSAPIVIPQNEADSSSDMHITEPNGYGNPLNQSALSHAGLFDIANTQSMESQSNKFPIHESSGENKTDLDPRTGGTAAEDKELKMEIDKSSWLVVQGVPIPTAEPVTNELLEAYASPEKEAIHVTSNYIEKIVSKKRGSCARLLICLGFFAISIFLFYFHLKVDIEKQKEKFTEFIQDSPITRSDASTLDRLVAIAGYPADKQKILRRIFVKLSQNSSSFNDKEVDLMKQMLKPGVETNNPDMINDRIFSIHTMHRLISSHEPSVVAFHDAGFVKSLIEGVVGDSYLAREAVIDGLIAFSQSEKIKCSMFSKTPELLPFLNNVIGSREPEKLRGLATQLMANLSTCNENRNRLEDSNSLFVVSSFLDELLWEHKCDSQKMQDAVMVIGNILSDKVVMDKGAEKVFKIFKSYFEWRTRCANVPLILSTELPMNLLLEETKEMNSIWASVLRQLSLVPSYHNLIMEKGLLNVIMTGLSKRDLSEEAKLDLLCTLESLGSKNQNFRKMFKMDFVKELYTLVLDDKSTVEISTKASNILTRFQFFPAFAKKMKEIGIDDICIKNEKKWY